MNGTSTRAGGRSWPWAALAALPALALLVWQASFVWPFFSDDAFISLRYSERLLAGDGLTWTDGERVEGYSNLLWVLLCALLGGLGLELVDAARLLGGAATAVALWCVAWAQRPHGLRSAAVAALAPLLVASAQVVLGWTLGGLEGPFVLCLLTWGMALLVRAHTAEPDPGAWPRHVLLRASAPFALLCLTRPDGPLWVLASGLALALPALRRGSAVAASRACWFGLVPAVAVLAQLGFRVAYYGDVVPNTAHVKAGFAPAAFGAGLEYVLAAVCSHLGLFAAAALAAGSLARWRAGRTLVLVLVLPVLAWLLYLGAIGGDHFPGRRLLHGALAPLALLAAAGARCFATTAPRAAVTAALLLLATMWDVHAARSDAQSHELRAEIWEWRGRVVGEALDRAFGAERPLLAVDAAGAVPFFSDLPALDLLGLCNRTIATTPEPAWLDTVVPGTPRPPGHLHGNGRYVMDRAPDLMLFGPPPGLPLPIFVSGVELEEDQRFLRGYRCVLVDLGEQRLVTGQVEALVMALWMRVEGRTGVRTSAGRIDVPAYLFGSLALRVPVQRRYQPPSRVAGESTSVDLQRQDVAHWFAARRAVAVPGADGAFLLELRDDAPAECKVPLPAGRWRARIEPGSAAITVTPATVELQAPGNVRIELAAKPGAPLPLRASRVVFHNEP